MAFENFKKLVQQDKENHDSVGSVVAARAVLHVALTRLAFPEFFLPVELGETTVSVEPQEDGTVRFYVDSFIGDAVNIMIRPEMFDPKRHEQLQEFKAFRAFVNDVRQLEAKEGYEAKVDIGPFEIFCSQEDMQKWATVWALWEHAHGH